MNRRLLTSTIRSYRLLNQTKRSFSANVRRSTRSPASNAHRLEELRTRLADDEKDDLPIFTKFVGEDTKYDASLYSDKARSFLRAAEIFNVRYDRGGKKGEGYVGVREVLETAKAGSPVAHTDDTKNEELLRLSADIQHQMRVKVSDAYMRHALDHLPEGAVEPSPILKVVLPDDREILYKEIGEVDPSNQNKYSPMAGLLHKYNMLLAMTSINCSSHCRYCYRSDLFNGSSGKEKADIVSVARYTRAYNRQIHAAIDEGEWSSETGTHINETGEPLLPLKEILLSGGDVMTLPNATVARYLVLMAEAGMKTVRFGSKELAFNPSRFDDSFFSTLDLFHQNYPDVRIELVGHYVHPYELVQPKIDAKGQYLYDCNTEYTVHPEVEAALSRINSRRSWFGHHNQFPVIAGVNDQPDIMRLILHLTNKLGITMHNVYACREVIGNPHFRGDLTIDRQYDLLEAAKIGLSGLENHARLIMSTEQGKMDVLGHKNGKIYLRLNRFVHGRKPENTMVIVDSKKIEEAGGKFYWLTQEVIDTAVDEAGRNMLNGNLDSDTEFIKSVKEKAALEVHDAISGQAQVEVSATVSTEAITAREATIEVEAADGSTVQVVHQIPEEGESLAEILEANGHVEMVCGGKLSCTTCVGTVSADQPLVPPSLDEIDATDTVEGHDGANLRACCQVKVKPGVSYKFVHLE